MDIQGYQLITKKNMEDIKYEDIAYTSVWRINRRQLVVADTIEDAIKIYQANYEFPYNEVESIENVRTDVCEGKALYVKKSD